MNTIQKHVKKIAAVIFLSSLIALTGCNYSGVSDEATNNSEVPFLPKTSVFTQSLPDGGSVVCIWAFDNHGGGLSCDWDSVK